ncbi:MAG: lipopolysaccharide biosynthesis protein [Armatimonadota bacterium]|nr:lipopolysaccharide biosynthesis protein [Armatimonadota bacterium]
MQSETRENKDAGPVTAADAFASIPTAHGLKERSLRGGAFTFASRFCLFCISTLSTVILARILSPDDFGVWAMASTLTAFAAIFRDLGLSTVTIQRPSITHAQVSTLFWINVGLGVVLALVVVASSPLVAWFYHRPELKWVTLVSSLGFVLWGLSLQHFALLTRQMRFRERAVVDVTAAAIAFVVVVLAALAGLRYWSLAIHSLAIATLSALGAWIASGWRPGPPVRNAGVREMLRFGANVTGINVLNYVARNLDTILIGRFCGGAVLGVYGKAYQLFMFPIVNLCGPIGEVAMPALSALQGSSQRYRDYYRRMLALQAFLFMPAVVIAYVCAPEVVRVVLGPKWDAVVPLFRLMGVAAFVHPAVGTGGILLLAAGRAVQFFRLGLCVTLVTALGFAVGVRWGAPGVAAAYSLVNAVLIYPLVWYVSRYTPVRGADFFHAVAGPAVISLLAGLLLWRVRLYLAWQPAPLLLLSCVGVGILLYLALWGTTRPGRTELARVFGYVTVMLSRSREKT